MLTNTIYRSGKWLIYRRHNIPHRLNNPAVYHGSGTGSYYEYGKLMGHNLYDNALKW